MGILTRIKLIVLINNYYDVLGEADSFRNHNKVSCAELHALRRTLVVGFHLPFEKIARLLCIKPEKIPTRRATPPI